MNDEHAIANAIHKINGYFLPSGERQSKPREEFERAKQECLANLRLQMECVERITWEKFTANL